MRVLLTCFILASAPSAHAWRVEVDGSASTADGANAVVADAAGNIIAAGSLENAGTNADFTVIKLDGASGSQLWRREIDGTASGVDRASAVAVDAADDVLAAGTIDNGSEFAVIKFSGASGAELWRKEISGTASGGVAFTVAADGSGDVIAAGRLFNTTTGEDFFVVKLAGGTGAELWRYQVSGVMTCCSNHEEATSLAIDASGDVVVGGSLISPTTAQDFAVIKLSGVDGSEVWRREIDGSFFSEFGQSGDKARAVEIDGAGDAIAAGYLRNELTGYDFVVIKFSGIDGSEVWRQEINGSRPGGAIDFAVALALDGSGNAVAGGAVPSPGSGPVAEFTVIKMAANNGAEIWRREIRPPTVRYAQLMAVATDTAGDVFAAGYLSRDFATQDDFAVLKLAGTAGSEIWRRTVDGSAHIRDRATALALDPAGNPVAVGTILNATSSEDFSVVRLDSADGIIGPVSGKRLMVRDRAGVPAARRIVVALRDSNLAVTTPGGPGDPTIHGAALRLLNPVTSESVSFVLPAGSHWRGLGNPDGIRGYKYTDSGGMNGPCRYVLMKPGRLRAVCLGSVGPIPFTLDEATQGSLTVSVQLGGTDPQCATFGGNVVSDSGIGNPGPGGLFRAKNAPAEPRECPAP